MKNVSAGIFAVLAVFLLSFNAQAAAKIGEDAPAFVALTRDGKKFDLAEMKNKVVIINFWATWCAPCRDELPALEAVWRNNKGKGLEILAVSVDSSKARRDVDQVAKYFSFPIAYINAVSKNDLVAPDTHVPTTYLIGKDGKVANILAPPFSPLVESVLVPEVKSLLDAKLADPKVNSSHEARPDGKEEEKPKEKTEEKPSAAK